MGKAFWVFIGILIFTANVSYADDPSDLHINENANDAGKYINPDENGDNTVAKKKKSKIKGITRSVRLIGPDMSDYENGEKQPSKIKPITVSYKGDENFENVPINFDLNSYAVKPEFFSILNAYGNVLNSSNLKDYIIHLNGYTDSSGSYDYNMDLSLNRAQAVYDYLILNCGVAPRKIVIHGFGEEDPLLPNTSRENRRRNRRVEFVKVQK